MEESVNQSTLLTVRLRQQLTSESVAAAAIATKMAAITLQRILKSTKRATAGRRHLKTGCRAPCLKSM